MHLTTRHPLAAQWGALCDHKNRPGRRMAGACGQCIEAVIRTDERRAVQESA